MKTKGELDLLPEARIYYNAAMDRLQWLLDAASASGLNILYDAAVAQSFALEQIFAANQLTPYLTKDCELALHRVDQLYAAATEQLKLKHHEPFILVSYMPAHGRD